MTIRDQWISPCGEHRLILGDCLEVLPTLGKVDAVVTDPPYGVNFKYESHDDSRAGYREWCDKWLSECRRACVGPVAISCGIANVCDWSQPDWILCWHKPASMGRCVVGFNNWEPVLLYGKSRAGQVVDVFRACIVPDKSLSGHPCPKPIEWGIAVIQRVSAEGDTILDPFMGSGTTGVACARTGRRFIGIEIEPKYYQIAIDRVKAELERHPLFEEPKPEQLTLDC